jgi:undecaprenyl-diphosphatase
VTAATVWLADLLAIALKAATDRPRPSEVVPEADPLLGGTVGTSLPSGHAATSFAGAVVLALLVRRAVPALVVLALAISFSRVYVGVHYPFDVLAGAALGAAVALAVGRPAAERLGARALPRPSEGPRRSGAAPPRG